MEYLDVYNGLGEPLGRSEERGIVHAQDLLHKAVQVWIINRRNELLLQRRSPDKILCPNMLDVSFAGHVQAGETSVQAVVREGKEELGIEVSLSNLEYLFSYREHRTFNHETYFENEISDIFLYKADVPLESCISSRIGAPRGAV